MKTTKDTHFIMIQFARSTFSPIFLLLNEREKQSKNPSEEKKEKKT